MMKITEAIWWQQFFQHILCYHTWAILSNLCETKQPNCKTNLQSQEFFLHGFKDCLCQKVRASHATKFYLARISLFVPLTKDPSSGILSLTDLHVHVWFC